jgi:hypothetical protein
MDGALRCHHCKDVIGAYEPMIALAAGAARETSRAAAREEGEPVEECYHRACYAQVRGNDHAPD